MKTLIRILPLLVLTGCGYLVDDEDVCRSTTTQGYSECRITGRHEISPHMLGGCGDDDELAADVAAKNPAGRTVSFTVCCGWPSKGCTIRTH
jgi:hypothetical protein